eukprot:Plantae.Rhodophyta-Rhodochaete_pulchella.ctg2382.p2 GENE.Plantae.Rhodophyta-Rhodochaete_pulchella.ctg2382~~Plantae.Rhodophyta-Rhodochaete_pulchella.ctg2382.p2  ORF type:complete len:190 (+),score=17.62 Plantae.Rhodophyta-Rhodochaete_pulchella.ctg2382:1-570(+)
MCIRDRSTGEAPRRQTMKMSSAFVVGTNSLSDRRQLHSLPQRSCPRSSRRSTVVAASPEKQSEGTGEGKAVPRVIMIAAGTAAVALVAVAAATSSTSIDTLGPVATGAVLFENNCAGCHPGGGNVIGYARGKTLKAKALARNGFDTKESIIDLMRVGKGAMPRYGDRLSDEELGTVADFVLQHAAVNWK